LQDFCKVELLLLQDAWYRTARLDVLAAAAAAAAAAGLAPPRWQM
jgi:hypothetical protein